MAEVQSNLLAAGATVTELPTVTLVVAMRNEERHIERCLASIAAQDYPSELLEVLVYDGASTDRSRAVAESVATGRQGWEVVDNPGVVQSSAWNLGIARARGDVIGIVSGHAELAPDYVSRAVETLRRTGADFVGGPTRAWGETYTARAIAIATSSPFGIGGSRSRYTDREEEVDTVFQALCRREVYERIGTFDPELTRNQDDELSYRLRANGGRIVCNPAIRSRYHNRGTLRSLARQYFAYGYWKVRVMEKHPRQMQVRHFVPPLFVAGVAGSAVWALVSPKGQAAFGLLGGSYVAGNVVATGLSARRHGARYAPLLPAVFATLHFSWGIGFLAGLLRRPGRKAAG